MKILHHSKTTFLFLLLYSTSECLSQTSIPNGELNTVNTITPITTTPILSLLFADDTESTAERKDVRTAAILVSAEGSGGTTTTILSETTTGFIAGSGSGAIDSTTQPVSTVTNSEITSVEAGSGIGENATTIIASTISSDATSSSFEGSGSGATVVPSDDTTTASSEFTTSSSEESGSGATAVPTDDATTALAEVTTSSPEGSGSGATIVPSVDTTTSSLDVSSTSDATTSVEDTTVTTILDFTANETITTNFTDITTIAAVGSSLLPWYIIVIICLGILLFILLIVFIVVCCLYKKVSPAPTKTKESTETTGPDKTVQDIKMQSLPAYVPQAKTIRPEPKEETKQITSFISDTPMVPPKIFDDPVYAAVVRGEKPKKRIKSKHSTPDEDEGYDEPLLRREKIHEPAHQRSVIAAQKRPHTRWEGESELVERAPTHYQPYYLPTPVQTALTSKALGNTLSDEALAQRHALQRSDIERHRNKQRMRSRHRKDPHQRDIDAVLVPPPPTILQPSAQIRKRLRKKHGRMDIADQNRIRHSDIQSLVNERPGKYRRKRSDTDTSTASEEKVPSHEATISKMAKLLEEAYALLAPAVQRNLIGPAAMPVTPMQQPAFTVQPMPRNVIPVVPPPPNHFQPEQNMPPLSIPRTVTLPIQVQASPPVITESPPKPDLNSKLFAPRTSTPPALLPSSNISPSQAKPSYAPYKPDRANDANSIIWTPYRTFDQLAQLQAEDPNFSKSSLTPYDMPTSSISHPGLVTDTLEYTPMFIPNQLFDSQPQTSIGMEASTPVEDNTEPTSSIVQSIKETLAKLAGSSTPVQEFSDPESHR
uniref:bromodomain-containing protein 4-like isoform X1 n=1 Tax=Styela clava TaxID=7725 RepID=UPI00193A370F|nr:bromodomain-containing protein 4-like isoform X1 [Styela clava]